MTMALPPRLRRVQPISVASHKPVYLTFFDDREVISRIFSLILVPIVEFGFISSLTT